MCNGDDSRPDPNKISAPMEKLLPQTKKNYYQSITVPDTLLIPVQEAKLTASLKQNIMRYGKWQPAQKRAVDKLLYLLLYSFNNTVQRDRMIQAAASKGQVHDAG